MVTGYSEQAFQQAWNGASFRLTGLISDTGNRIDVVHPGRWNQYSGPDFMDAKVSVDGMLFTGGIELHRDPAEWYQHGHHQDPVYNQVVLHVSPSRANRPILRQDGTRVPHINIGEMMPGWLPQAVKIQPRLVCNGIIGRNLDALNRQLEQASAQYFEELCGRLLNIVRLGKPFQSELVRSMAIRTGSILGAPANRETMAEAASIMWDHAESATNLQLKSELTCNIHWRNHCGRPATKPSRRISQLENIVQNMKGVQFDSLWRCSPQEVVRSMLGDFASPKTAGIVQGSIIIPAQWLMASNAGDHAVASESRQNWDRAVLPAAPEAAKAFAQIVGQIDRRHHKALTWLHRNQCSARNCTSCAVGNRMIS